MTTPNTNEFEVTVPLLKSKKTSTAAALRYTLTPMLVPDKPDYQGDRISAEEIEKAVWGISLKKGLMDMEHSLVTDPNIGEPVEKYVLPSDTIFVQTDEPSADVQDKLDQIAALQKELSEKYPDEIRLVQKGTGMLGVIWSPKVWGEIKAGQKNGLSIWGKGTRTEFQQEEGK